MKNITEKDLQLLLEGAIALEYGLAEAAEAGCDIGNALNHAQAILAELSSVGINLTEEK